MPQGLDRAEGLLKAFYPQYNDFYGEGSFGLAEYAQCRFPWLVQYVDR